MENQTTHPSPGAKLAEALSKAQAKIKAPLKNRTVDFSHEGRRTKYSYADLADVIEAVKGPLSANGLAIVHQLQFTPNGYGLTTLLVHSSGEYVDTFYPLPDPSKIKPQQFGSALTYGRRYSLSSLIGIASEDDDDGGAAPSPEKPPQKPQPLPTPKPKEHLTPQPPGAPVSEAQLKRLFAISHEKGWTHEQCKLYMVAAWGLETSKDLDRVRYDKLISVIESGPYVKAITGLGGLTNG